MVAIGKLKKGDDKYHWTQHSLFKLKQHGLSQSRVKRVIRHPDRIEEGIVESTIAVMQKTGNSKNKTEIWAMYQLKSGKFKVKSEKEEKNAKIRNNNLSPAQKFRLERQQEYASRLKTNNKQIRIISAWRYPGETSKNDPIPEEIIQEVQEFLGV